MEPGSFKTPHIETMMLRGGRARRKLLAIQVNIKQSVAFRDTYEVGAVRSSTTVLLAFVQMSHYSVKGLNGQ